MSLSNGEKEVILEFVFLNKQNLELALKIYEAGEDIRKRILSKIFDRLEELLRKELPSDWNIVNEYRSHIYDRYKGIYITKRNWIHFSIEISPDKYGACDFYVGIHKDKKLPPIRDGELLNVLDEFFGAGKSNDEYEWWRWLDRPYRDFTEIDLLVKTQSTDEVEKYFLEIFMRIRELSESLIDASLLQSK